MVSFFFRSRIEFAKFCCGCVKPKTPPKKKKHAIAHHQPRPAQHLPATSHSRIISNTLMHTPPETRQASNTTSDTPHHDTLRDTSQPHPQSRTTGSNTLHPHIQSSTTIDTPNNSPSNILRDTFQPHPRSDTTRNIPNDTLSDTRPNTSLPNP